MLVTGGARSGKSRYAQEQVSALAASTGRSRVLFIATAEASDEEMRERIARHRQDRPAAWDVREAPLGAADVLEAAQQKYDIILLDCLTLFVSNILLAAGEISHAEIETGVDREIERLCRAARSRPAGVILVTNEVGMGLHAMTALGRLFVDVAGRANQRVAAAADEVTLMVCGLPLAVKSPAVMR